MKISLSQGEVKGIKQISVLSGQTYYSFLGIPYAEPPINLLRFKAPRPSRGWNVTLDGTKSPNCCPQRDRTRRDVVIGDEDCLYVNVHLPGYSDNVSKLKPVIVFVHGGAFSTGEGDMYSPDYLINYDVVIVTFNYRLHAFGFLNLDLPECPSNVGLKDQILAFKWIKSNIKAFGGDPSNITAVGESAGAASVHYLMLSPMAHGLFHKAILQSGHALCTWAFSENPVQLAFLLGDILGCKTTDKKELYNFLLEVPAQKIVKAVTKLTSQLGKTDIVHLPFVPSVENEVHPNDIFLPDRPDLLLNNIPNIPLIMGLNDLEGLIFFLGGRTTFLEYQNDNFHIIPDDIRSLVSRFPMSINRIKEFYFKNKFINEKTMSEAVDLISDVCFMHGFNDVYLPIMKKKEAKSVYIYKFSYEGQMNMLKKFCAMMFDIDFKGSCHGDELFYLFNVKMEFETSIEEKEMINTMCTLWTNFAKYGSPSFSSKEISWYPTSVHNPMYLHIDNCIEMKRGKINESRENFWKNLRKDLQLKTGPTHSAL